MYNYATGKATALTFVLILVAACSPSGAGSGQETAATSEAPAQAEDPVVANRPPDQAALLGISDQAEHEVIGAPNSYRANQLEDKWAENWCAALRSLHEFKGWTGTIWRVEQGRLEVDVGGGIHIIADVDKSSPMFRDVIASLKERQVVKVTGTFEQASITCGAWADVGGSSGSPYDVHLTAVEVL